MPRKFNLRQSPGDHDQIAPETQSFEFDYTYAGGAAGWPERHGSIRFGPSLIRKAWAAGLIVYAVIEGFPYPIAVREAQWLNNTLAVQTLEGLKTPTRIFTRTSVKNMNASGLLIESGD